MFLIINFLLFYEGERLEKKTSFDFHTFYYSYKTLHLSLQSKKHSPKKGRMKSETAWRTNKMKKKKLQRRFFQLRWFFIEKYVTTKRSVSICRVSNIFQKIRAEVQRDVYLISTHTLLFPTFSRFSSHKLGRKLFCYFIVIIEKR